MWEHRIYCSYTRLFACTWCIVLVQNAFYNRVYFSYTGCSLLQVHKVNSTHTGFFLLLYCSSAAVWWFHGSVQISMVIRLMSHTINIAYFPLYVQLYFWRCRLGPDHTPTRGVSRILGLESAVYWLRLHCPTDLSLAAVSHSGHIPAVGWEQQRLTS